MKEISKEYFLNQSNQEKARLLKLYVMKLIDIKFK